MKSSNSRRRRLLAGGAVVAALGLGGTGVAIAQSGGASPSSSSVTVADSGAENAAEDAALAAAAKITPDAAKAAALAAVPGTAGKVELENENGNVVFGVEVTTASGSRVDVKVDAGNGKVLAQEADDGAEGPGKGTESPTPAGAPSQSSTGK